MVAESELAYTAGLFDGEGCITILREKSGGKPPYMRLSIGSTDRAVIEWLCCTFEGSLSKASLSGAMLGAKQLYNFRLCDQRAAAFLTPLLPYLRIKKAQANLAIEFQSRKREGSYSRRRIPDEERATQIEYAVAMGKLND